MPALPTATAHIAEHQQRQLLAETGWRSHCCCKSGTWSDISRILSKGCLVSGQLVLGGSAFQALSPLGPGSKMPFRYSEICMTKAPDTGSRLECCIHRCSTKMSTTGFCSLFGTESCSAMTCRLLLPAMDASRCSTDASPAPHLTLSRCLWMAIRAAEAGCAS